MQSEPNASGMPALSVRKRFITLRRSRPTARSYIPPAWPQRSGEVGLHRCRGARSRAIRATRSSGMSSACSMRWRRCRAPPPGRAPRAPEGGGDRGIADRVQDRGRRRSHRCAGRGGLQTPQTSRRPRSAGRSAIRHAQRRGAGARSSRRDRASPRRASATRRRGRCPARPLERGKLPAVDVHRHPQPEATLPPAGGEGGDSLALRDVVHARHAEREAHAPRRGRARRRSRPASAGRPPGAASPRLRAGCRARRRSDPRRGGSGAWSGGERGQRGAIGDRQMPAHPAEDDGGAGREPHRGPIA